MFVPKGVLGREHERRQHLGENGRRPAIAAQFGEQVT
jgi:hypothetical protein